MGQVVKSGFSAAALGHFTRPAHKGKLELPTGVGTSGSRQVGQWARVEIELRQGLVTRARFQSFNCVPTVASAEFLCGWVEGKSLTEARAATPAMIFAELGEFPPNRRFCAALALDALCNALIDTEEKTK